LFENFLKNNNYQLIINKYEKISRRGGLILSILIVLGFSGSALAAGPATVNLLSAGNYIILSKTAITTTGATSITGDLGISPAASTAMTGFSLVLDGSGTFSTSALVDGNIYASNYSAPTPDALTTAISAMEAAYTDAATRTPGVGASNLNLGAGTLNGNTLVPGTYTWGSDVTITGDITLAGAAEDVWIFQISGNLDIQNGIEVLLSGGASPANIFWQVAGTTTLLPGSTFVGNILAGPGASTIAMQSGAVLNGRALGQTDVTLIGNTVSIAESLDAPDRRRGETVILPIIGIRKVPSPLALPLGPGPVTYDYTVWNIGALQALTDITVVDDKCTPVSYISGDFNNNKKIDLNETWKYRCTTPLSLTTTNTAIATGHSDDSYHQSAIATAIATVVVGTPLPAPLIHIVKVPSQLTPLPYGGGPVVYRYTVTNPGIVPVQNVSVTDDKCSPISSRTGDTNGNNALDVTETWRYICETNVHVSTGSVATAKGDANGFTALAYSFTNVLVAAPDFPDTALGLQGITFSWVNILLVIAVVILSVRLHSALKKRKSNN
jgi:hypothetical protein